MKNPRASYLHFFMVEPDLRHLLTAIEEEYAIQYVLYHYYDSPQPTTYLSVADFPQIGTTDQPSAATGAQYFILQGSASLRWHTFQLRTGGIRYAFNQPDNPESVVFQPNGRFGGDAIIAGSLCAATQSGWPSRLMKRYSQILAAACKRRRSYFIGPAAYDLAKSGARLVTMGTREPPEYDLKVG